MNRGKWIAACVALILCLAGGVFAFGYFREDPQLAKARELGEQMRDQDWRNMPDEQRRARWEEMRTVMDALTEDQRRALWEEREQEWAAREDQRLEEFFALSPQEQQKALDEEIKREEERRKAWEQRRANGDRGRQRDSGERTRGDRGDRGPGGRGGPPGANGGRGGRNMDPQARNERMRDRLDRSSPQSRARRAEHRRLIAERRQQLGLPPQTRGRR